MTTGVILDTGPLVALLDRDERHHEWAKTQLDAIRPPIVTCEAVLTETCHLLRSHPVAVNHIARFLESGVLSVPFSIGADHESVFALMKKYRDVPMSFADACLVRMVETGMGRLVFTLDTDFQVYRQRRRRMIEVIAPF
ncbi:MAG: type II toxin-antitoxin system VapC family toxin [Rhodothermia bacterium]